MNDQFPRLVAAASDGVLPQYRLDLEDEVEEKFGTLADDQRARLMTMYRQEVDAALQQNRLNPTIVTQAAQVQPNGAAAAIRKFFAVLVGIATLFFGGVGLSGLTQSRHLGEGILWSIVAVCLAFATRALWGTEKPVASDQAFREQVGSSDAASGLSGLDGVLKKREAGI